MTTDKTVIIAGVRPAADSKVTYPIAGTNQTGRNLFIFGEDWVNHRRVTINNVGYNINNILPDVFTGPFMRPTIYFDGATYGTVGHEQSQIVRTDGTIACSVYWSGTLPVGGTSVLISKGVPGNIEYELRITTGGEIVWYDNVSGAVFSGLYVAANTLTFVLARRRECKATDVTTGQITFMVGTTVVSKDSARGEIIQSNGDIYIGCSCTIAVTSFYTGCIPTSQILDYGVSATTMAAMQSGSVTAPWGSCRYEMFDYITPVDLDINPEVWVQC